MYTFELTLCALVAILGLAAIVTEKLLDYFVFDEIDDDEDEWFEAE